MIHLRHDRFRNALVLSLFLAGAAICGAHRTGKSTLARTYAEKHGVTYIESNVSGIFRELDLDPSVTYPFEVRLSVQELILKRLDEAYAAVRPDVQAVTDRTPLDLMMYTLGDIAGNTVSDDLQPRVQKYLSDCIGCTNKRFSMLLIVQPGIPVVEAPGKASTSAAYIEHCNSLVLGLSVDERIRPSHFYLPRSMTDLTERVAALEYAVNKVRMRALSEREGYPLH